VSARVAPLGRQGDVVVNYDHFSIRPELMDAYAAMVQRLSDRWYATPPPVTRLAATCKAGRPSSKDFTREG
jgi:hypothetical protein